MSKTTEMKNIANKMNELGIAEYQYQAEAGKVIWKDADGNIQAYADCKAIMSFASTNNSYRWGLYPNTPTLNKPDWASDMQYDVTEEQSRESALKAAVEAEADFMFAGNWLTLTVYLACWNIQYGSDITPSETAPWHPVEGDMSKHADLINGIIDKIMAN